MNNEHFFYRNIAMIEWILYQHNILRQNLTYIFWEDGNKALKCIQKEIFIELIENKNIQEEIKIFFDYVDIVMMLFNWC